MNNVFTNYQMRVLKIMSVRVRSKKDGVDLDGEDDDVTAVNVDEDVAVVNVDEGVGRNDGEIDVDIAGADVVVEIPQKDGSPMLMHVYDAGTSVVDVANDNSDDDDDDDNHRWKTFHFLQQIFAE